MMAQYINFLQFIASLVFWCCSSSLKWILVHMPLINYQLPTFTTQRVAVWRNAEIDRWTTLNFFIWGINYEGWSWEKLDEDTLWLWLFYYTLLQRKASEEAPGHSPNPPLKLNLFMFICKSLSLFHWMTDGSLNVLSCRFGMRLISPGHESRRRRASDNEVALQTNDRPSNVCERWWPLFILWLTWILSNYYSGLAGWRG